MSYLVNPSQVVVEVDDPQEIKSLLKKGFRLALPTEIQTQKVIKELRNLDSPEGIYFYTHSGRNDGYGTSAEWLKTALMKQGIAVSTQYSGQQVGLVYGLPELLDSLQTPVKILYTMTESTGIPDAWLPSLKKADLICVPSRFCYDAFEKSGVNTKIIPLGYDPDDYFVMEKPPKSETSKFTFLHYDAFNTRKGWDLVFNAFTKEFRADEPVELIFKTRLDVLPFPIKRSQYPNIQVIKGVTPAKELRELNNFADCFVFPSRGEGFGLTPLEALACGTAGIVPNFSGMSEYFTKDYFYDVRLGQKVPAMYQKPMGAEVGVMFEADEKDLQKQMRYAYEHKDEVAGKGQAGSIWVKANYTINHTAKAFADIIREYELSPKTTIETTKLSIIMLSYNALEWTKKAVKAIYKNTVTPFELIIVDNASNDSEVKQYLTNIQETNKNIKVILNAENKGVSAGRNQGIEQVTSDFVVFLDNDTEVQSGWDTKILSHFIDGRVGAVSRGGCDVMNMKPLTFKAVGINSDGIGYPDTGIGYCLTVKREMFDLIGVFYENFPNRLYWHDDFDFCKRIKMTGHLIVMDTKIPIVHHEHKSMGEDSHAVHKAENQFGFQENANTMMERYREKNVIFFHHSLENYNSAYSVIARNLATALRKLGMVVIYKQPLNTPPISFNLCKGFDMFYAGKRLVTLHIENDVPPKSWEMGMKYVDYALTTSGHAFHAVEDTNYASKVVNIMPNIINKLFNPRIKLTQETVDRFGDPEGKNSPFIFLFNGATQPRKNTPKLIEWYCETFTKKDNVLLILKDGYYGDSSTTLRIIAEQKQNKNCPNIEYIQENLPVEKLAQLYRRAALKGAYISPHKAEGFGLPVCEALACGCVVGVTNFGGVAHYLNKFPTEMVTLFPYSLAPSLFHNHSQEPYYSKDEKPMWAEPKEESVKAFMRDVVNTKYDKLRADKSYELIKNFAGATITGKKVYEFLTKKVYVS